MSEDVRQQMIDTMVTLLAKKGLQRASFSEVIEGSNAPRGSLYHYFPEGKEELVLAALGVSGDRALHFLDTLEGKLAVEVTRSFLGLWRAVLERSSFNAGCAVMAVTVAADSPALHEAAAHIFASWRQRLTELLILGGVAKARAAAIAALVISASEGAVALSRAERSFHPFDLTAAELLAVVESVTRQNEPANT